MKSAASDRNDWIMSLKSSRSILRQSCLPTLTQVERCTKTYTNLVGYQVLFVEQAPSKTVPPKALDPPHIHPHTLYKPYSLSHATIPVYLHTISLLYWDDITPYLATIPPTCAYPSVTRKESFSLMSTPPARQDLPHGADLRHCFVLNFARVNMAKKACLFHMMRSVLLISISYSLIFSS